MATGGFKPNASTDFLEEWKAKREKMRAKMLGDIAAATGVCVGTATGSASQGTNSNKSETRSSAPPTAELNNNNGNPDRGGSAPVNCVASNPMARSSSSSAIRRPDEDPHLTPAPRCADTGNPKKAPPPEKAPPASPQSDANPAGCTDSDKESSSPSKSKEKKSSGPSARKGKGQIEKRKLREKRRSTGVVSIPSNESLDELDDDDGVEKNRKQEEELTQQNTVQNEAMSSDPAPAHLAQESPRSGSGRHKSSTGPSSEERHGYGRHGSAGGGGGSVERRLEELEKELAAERQENSRLVKAHQDKDELIDKLKEEIDLLNRDLDDIEDENEQLKQENKTLLKVVGQLTR